MAVRPDHEAAVAVSIAGCDACRCGNLTLRLHDAEGRIFASASLSPAVGEVVMERMADSFRRARAGGLAAIVCEGSA